MNMTIYLIISASIMLILAIGGAGIYHESNTESKIQPIAEVVPNSGSPLSCYSADLQLKIEKLAKLKKVYEDVKDLDVNDCYIRSISEKIKFEIEIYESIVNRYIGEEQMKLLKKSK